jgi:hypothetical protein
MYRWEWGKNAGNEDKKVELMTGEEYSRDNKNFQYEFFSDMDDGGEWYLLGSQG